MTSFKHVTQRVYLAASASLLLALITLAGCTSAPIEPGAVADGVTVRKSPNDTREYRYLELPNKLRAVLVSDPQTEKSAAALAVYRGSMHEPDNRPGLAHFLEHMLFIQTETYPEIDGFQNYIRAGGGSSNAYTALDHTNYFFDIQPAAFDEALSRFAHFFIDPIISQEYSLREKNAVDSEYRMQLRDDGWRGYMVGKQAINPAHPASRFTIGSLDTLDGDIHEDLTVWFETNYSADQMGLVVVSPASLDDIEAQVTPLFGRIANKDIGPAHPTVPMYTDAELPTRLDIATLKEGAQVSYLFPMPSTRPLYRTKPQLYIGNLLGHEGTGSLYQTLKQRGWIETLSAGSSDLDHNASALSVTVELTPDGEANLDRITGLLFQYVDLIRDQAPQQWLYDEQAQVAALGFRFQEKSTPMSLVYQLAPRIDHFPPSDLLVAPFLMEGFDAARIEEFLSYVTPDNMLMQVQAAGVVGETEEPWFNVPYTLSRTEASRTPVADAGFTLPQSNPFLPDDLTLKPEDDTAVARALDEPGLEIWLDADPSFGSPRANLLLEIAVEDGFESPRDRGMAQLYRLLVEDRLSELTYPAYLAGLGYSLSVPDAGFEVRVSGYQDKQRALLEPVLAALMESRFTEERFDSLKASLIKDWRNAAKERPFRQAFAALSDTLRSGRWPRPQLIAAMEPVTLEDLEAWRAEHLDHVAVRGLLHGNVGAADAQALGELLKAELPLAEQTFVTAEARDVVGALRLQLPVEHDDATLVLHIQDPDTSYASRARSSLGAQILQPDYFMELRTEQQLGYVVSVSNRPVAKRGGISFIVQSPNTSSAGLEAATRAFVDTFVANWSDISDADFEQHKAGLINRLLQTPKNLNERTQQYWADLTDEVLTFDSRQQVADIVATLTREDMAAFFERLQENLTGDRLVIFTRGKFEEIPEEGTLLSDATQDWSDAPKS